jgi:hypothetical protein
LLLQLDLSVTFDTVDHTRLQHRLDDLRIHDTVSMWFTPYLTKRTQVIKVNEQRLMPRNWTAVFPRDLSSGLFCSTSTQHHSGPF